MDQFEFKTTPFLPASKLTSTVPRLAVWSAIIIHWGVNMGRPSFTSSGHSNSTPTICQPGPSWDTNTWSSKTPELPFNLIDTRLVRHLWYLTANKSLNARINDQVMVTTIKKPYVSRFASIQPAQELCLSWNKAKILLIFFYMVGICKLEVIGTITW